MAKPKSVITERVLHQRNIELGIDPYCHECVSHSKDGGGYCRVLREGYRWKLHRWVWYQETGEIPEVVMHLCDNPCCANLSHLKAGTVADNNDDKISKGRWGGPVVLSLKQVEEIRDLYVEGNSQYYLANLYSISQSQISSLVHGESYKTAGGPVQTHSCVVRNRKLCDSDVSAIANRAKKGESAHNIAKEYNVCAATIYNIINKRYAWYKKVLEAAGG